MDGHPVPWKLRLSAALMLFFGALLVLNMGLGSYIILAKPDAGRFAPGGELTVDVYNGSMALDAPVQVTVGDGACLATEDTPCVFDLEVASGSVTVQAPAGNLTRPYYIVEGAEQTWRLDLSAPDDGLIGPTARDAIIPLSLALAGAVAIVGGVRLWRVQDWRLPLVGAALIGLAGLVLFNAAAIFAGVFGAWAVLKETDRLKGVVLPSGDEEE